MCAGMWGWGDICEQMDEGCVWLLTELPCRKVPVSL